tara:strand:- start:1631 stop:3094 length:1464 start_codon:yes stop_codon:yes gene_type:complete
MAITKLPRNAIADNAINADKIEDGTVAVTEISGTVSAAKLNSTLDISGKTVTLPNTSVTSDMISGTIANAKLSNSSITVRGTARNLGDTFTIGTDVDWQAVKTSGFTAAASKGYFVNTTSGAVTVTLPSSASIGDTIAIKDYAGTFATNNLTIARNGHNIQGTANNSEITTNRASLVLVYVDATKGWLYAAESNVADLQTVLFISATGGTVATSGDFKIHSFTGDGNFVVANTGNAPIGGPASVDYLVVAGGAGASGNGGGGAGGFRTSYPSPAGVIPVSAQTYPITVGGGASGTSNGSNSVFSTITSAGGGGGNGPTGNGNPGGSGGGGAIRCFPGPGSGSHVGNAGAGNTPPTSPSQGNNGGHASPRSSPAAPIAGGGGGGAGGAGSNGAEGPPGTGGNGGAGTANSITGSSVTRAGGGGGGVERHYGPTQTFVGGTGGSGGGGIGQTVDGGSSPSNGTANTGGGAGARGGVGGSGIVIIRYKFQ